MKQTKQTYSSRSKIADLINSNHAILSIVERLNIKLGFGEATVADICNRYGISVELFISLCNIYTYEDFIPPVELLGKEDMLTLVTYLNISHTHYKKKLFPALHKKIHRLLENKDASNQKIINKFYDDYDTEINNHFSFEENIVFPYIKKLAKEKPGNRGFSVVQFEENHTNIEDKLGDLKSIIIKYLPEDYSQSQRVAILRDIFTIERDMRRHTLIEDKLLIPLVMKIEK